jgi:integrase
MEQRLTLYRRHTALCAHTYPTDDRIYDPESPQHDPDRPDCLCPIVASGKLKLEEGRILHRSTGTKDWTEARRCRDLWLSWGQSTEPLDPLKVTNPNTVTIDEAVRSFLDFGRSTNTKGNSTDDKYDVLFEGRVKPYCKVRGIRFIKEFDDAVTVKQFFMSWRNLQPTRGKKDVPADPNKPLAPNTKRAELERFRSFLRCCQSNGWIKTNYAVPPHIKMGKVDVKKKVAWTMAEYGIIVKTLETWTDEYGRTNTPKAKMQYAFAMCLRYTGQRISDVSMLGPDNITSDQGDDRKILYFIEVTQIKTGEQVKLPVTAKLVDMLRSLPVRGELPEPFVYETNNRTIAYGTKFWFWTGESDVEGNAKAWSDDISRVLHRAQLEPFTKFKHHSTPHTFRHFFAITMLNTGKVRIEDVSRWLGHSSVRVTEKHYGNANSDVYKRSHSIYHEALAALEGTAVPKPQAVGQMRKTG